MKKRKTLCALLVAMLVLISRSVGYVYAAQESESSKISESVDFPTEESQTAPEILSESTTEFETESDSTNTITEEELAAYYGSSVFIGDSIMVGFRNYCAKQKTFVHDIQFLAAGNYSAFNAMKPVTANNVHPMYRGKKYQVWNAIPLIGSQRVFLLLGMNDLSILGLEGARDQYKLLIDKILETSPDVEIHLISVTYTLPDLGQKTLNNENIAQYNLLLQKMAAENNWGYIDLVTPISDGNGNLAAECCSDGYVHLSKTAYALWENALIDYAYTQTTSVQEETELEILTEDTTETDMTPESQTETEIKSTNTTLTPSGTKSKIESILETPAKK